MFQRKHHVSFFYGYPWERRGQLPSLTYKPCGCCPLELFNETAPPFPSSTYPKPQPRNPGQAGNEDHGRLFRTDACLKPLEVDSPVKITPSIVNSAATNVGVPVSFLIMVFSECMPSSGIAGSCGSFILSFFGTLHIPFSIVPISISTSTNSARELSFHYILSSTYCLWIFGLWPSWWVWRDTLL